MSQIVYTELEATPIRWRYNEILPYEPETTINSSTVNLNTPQTDIHVINNTNANSTFNIQSASTYVAQRFKVSQIARCDGFSFRMNS